jgi:raffinose/stachyose/melibiose transport system permease protein
MTSFAIAAQPLSSKRRYKRRIDAVGRHVLLMGTSLLVLIPVAYMVLASFKSVPDFFGNPYGLPSKWMWENYTRAWNEAKIATTLPNSIIVTASAVLVSSFLSALIGYGLSRREKPFAKALYLLFVGGMLVPAQMIVLPLFILLRAVGLFGTLFALIFPYIALGLPLGVLILTPIIATLPRELSDAARVDGASDWQIFWRIILPLLRPGLASVSILNGVWMWNEFFIPLVVAFKAQSQTMPVGIISFIGTYSTEWGLVFASVVVSTAPAIVAYLLMTQQFVAGLTAGAMKG